MLAVKHTRALEVEIDRRVYALYGLTPEEIALVEGQSREEREAPLRTGCFSLRRMAPFARDHVVTSIAFNLWKSGALRKMLDSKEPRCDKHLEMS